MKIAVLGCGLIASRWMRALTADPRITITCIADPDPIALGHVAQRHSLTVPHASDWRQALQSIGLDAIVNLTPPDLHAQVSATALDAGLHVLTEKPLALSLDDATNLVHRAEKAGRQLLVMQNRALDPYFLHFRDLVHAEGGPAAINADTLVALHRPGFRAHMNHPVLADLAIHAFDQVRQLTAAEAVTVHAVEVPLTQLGPHCGLATATIGFGDGSVFCYRGGYIPGGIGTPAGGRWNVTGRELCSAWDGARRVANAAIGVPNPAWTELPEAPPGYQLVIQAMIDSLHGTPHPELAAHHNLGSIALLDAALSSATSARPSPVGQQRPRRSAADAS